MLLMPKGSSVQDRRKENKMESFGLVVLIIFILIRVMIAAGLVYLIVYEVRKYKKSREDKEGEEDANTKEAGKHVNRSSGS